MKVSTKLFNQQQLKQFTSLNEEIQKTQNKISTGKNILLASDDPTGSVQLSGLQVIRDQIKQYNENIETSKERLTSLDKNLQNMNTIMIRAQELIIQASSDVLGPSDRESIALEIDEMKHEILSIANAQDSTGSFLFAGYKTNTLPFEKDYNG
jgi:flagellar hook-associated protein 3 FlgL